jgi:hypothetical protein
VSVAPPCTARGAALQHRARRRILRDVDTGEIITAVLVGAGVLVTVVIFLIQRPAHRAQERREADAARPKLSAELLEGPTAARAPYTSGFQYRYRVVNHGTQSARDPRAEIIDAATGDPVEPNGASLMGTDGLLHAGKSAEAVITVPSLERPMKVKLMWYAYEDPDLRTHISRAPVPQSEEEAAAGWSAHPPDPA